MASKVIYIGSIGPFRYDDGIETGSHAPTFDDLTGALAGAVLLTGPQTIAGVKTFTSFPVTPSSAPSTNYQVANKKYVDDEIAGTEYVAGSVTINTGTLNSGAYTDTNIMFDGNVLDVQEVAATPGFDIEFTIPNVTKRIREVVARWIYNGLSSHYVTWELYNVSSAAWDQLRMFVDSSGYHDSMTMSIPASVAADYIDGSGNVKIRVYHNTAGNPAHNIQIDYIGLVC